MNRIFTCDACGFQCPLNEHDTNYLYCMCGKKHDLAAMTKLPSISVQVWNFIRAKAKHIANGSKTVDKELMAKRISICNSCSFRKGNRCAKCGCPITEKAVMITESCPVKLW